MGLLRRHRKLRRTITRSKEKHGDIFIHDHQTRADSGMLGDAGTNIAEPLHELERSSICEGI